MRMLGMGIRVRSLTTLGTPWMGTVPLRWAFGEVSKGDLMGQEFAMKLAAAPRPAWAAATWAWPRRTPTITWSVQADGTSSSRECWTTSRCSASGAPTSRAAGGGAEVWPNDGLVSEFSAHGAGLPAALVPRQVRRSFPVTHSIFICDLIGAPWPTGMTWNEEVLSCVADFLADPGAAGSG
jgi:hypothetical protein